MTTIESIRDTLWKQPLSLLKGLTWLSLIFLFSPDYLIAQQSPKSVVAFVYHRFGDSRFPSTNISLSDFEAHLKYLKAQNYTVLTLSEALAYLKTDGNSGKVAVLTIDDGYQTFYEAGLPLLEKYGFSATLFVNTETVGSKDYMSWEALNDAQNRGIEIGNHTHSHAYFLNMTETDRYSAFENELKDSQELLKDHLGKAPAVFAYPYGELDPKMKQVVGKMGFSAAAAQNSGVISTYTDLFQLPRFPMSESYASIEKFISKAKMKPLVVLSENPASFLIPNNDSKPTLSISFEKGNLFADQLQCFIQGSTAQKSITEKDGIISVAIQAQTPITARRRTLYTVTVPDKEGNWHWYSHLWINPKKD